LQLTAHNFVIFAADERCIQLDGGNPQQRGAFFRLLSVAHLAAEMARSLDELGRTGSRGCRLAGTRERIIRILWPQFIFRGENKK